MKEQRLSEKKEKSVLNMLEEQYLEADNKKEIDFWAPLSRIIIESVELRDSKEMSQTDLANIMKTRQSVISRFENMGRLPNYDFIARLSLALGHSPGITLYGDYMAIVPLEKQHIIKQLANNENITTSKFVQDILNQSIDSIVNKTNIYSNSQSEICSTTARLSVDYNNSGEPSQALVAIKNEQPDFLLAVSAPKPNNDFALAS
jgi:transcriptional regulator with XRE-family HTH domain